MGNVCLKKQISSRGFSYLEQLSMKQIMAQQETCELISNAEVAPARLPLEDSLYAFFEALPQAVWFVREGIILAANPSAQELYGGSKEITGTPASRWLLQSGPDETACGMRPDGVALSLTVKVSRLELADGPVQVFFLTAVSSRASDLAFRKMVENADEIIYETDIEGRFNYISPAVTKWLGWQPEEIIGKLHRDFLPPANSAKAQARLQLALSGAKQLQTYQWPGKDGSLRWLQVCTTPVVVEGKVVGLHGAARDITELKQNEEEIRASRERYRAFIAQSSVSIFRYELERPVPIDLPVVEQGRRILEQGAFAECNLAMAQRFHTTPASLTGRGLADILNVTPEYYDICHHFIASGYHLTNLEVFSHSSNGWLLNNFIGIVENGCLTRVWGTQRDITKQKQAEEALHKSEQRLELALRSSELALWDLDVATKDMYVNEQWFRQLGYEPDAADSILTFWRAHLHPDDKERVMKNYEALLAGETRSYNAEHRMRNKQGQWLWLAVQARIVEFSEDGKPLRIIGVNGDITERKKREEQLQQSAKMEAIGRLASGVAHDFNNLLTIIKGYADISLQDLPATDPLHSRVREISQAAVRAAELTQQLLTFSRNQELLPQVLNLNTIVSRVKNMLRRLIGTDIILNMTLEPDLPNINADPHQIERVLFNLVVNARDAMPQGGCITISTANAETGQSQAVSNKLNASPNQSYIMLSVRDTGHGMDVETQQRIFEPFFTTKERGQGTGLGLATVYGIIQQSGGDVTCQSLVGQGTSFNICLPVVTTPATASVAKEPDGSLIQRSRETISLAEDETVRAASTRPQQVAADISGGRGQRGTRDFQPVAF